MASSFLTNSPLLAEGLTNDLLLAAFVVWLSGFWICSRDLPFLVALAVTSVKVAIPVVYFAWFFDGAWTFLDDLTYLSRGSLWLQHGLTPVRALIAPSPEGITFFMSSALYEWWNLLAQWLFGQHYYAPVFLNVLLTFVSGYFLFRLVRLSGFGEGYARGLLLFFLLYWDVLAWSSVANLKDTLVMTLTIISFYFILKLSKQLTLGSLLMLGAMFVIFTAIRFYVPVFMIMSGAIWGVLYLRGRRRSLLLLLCSIGGLGLVGKMGLNLFTTTFAQFSPASVYSTMRVIFSPVPWSISPEYSFLLLPSVLHWLLFLPALLGGWMLWRQSREAALLLIYLALILLLYVFVPEQQGPRHRFQVDFVIAWAQFHFFWVMIREAVSQAALARKANALHEVKVQRE